MKVRIFSLLALCGILFVFLVDAAPRDSNAPYQEIYAESSNNNAINVSGDDSRTEKGLSINKEKREDSHWALALYTGMDCEDDYFFVEGNNVQDSYTCMDLHGYMSSEYTDNGVFCKYYTNGGFDSVKCADSMAVPIRSWILTGGVCLAYENNCTTSGGNSQMILPSKSCQKWAPKIDSYISVESLRCFARGY